MVFTDTGKCRKILLTENCQLYFIIHTCKRSGVANAKRYRKDEARPRQPGAVLYEQGYAKHSSHRTNVCFLLQ